MILVDDSREGVVADIRNLVPPRLETDNHVAVAHSALEMSDGVGEGGEAVERLEEVVANREILADGALGDGGEGLAMIRLYLGGSVALG